MRYAFLRLRAWLIRRLGVTECGAFGGAGPNVQRWCRKPFGHSDSCMFEIEADLPSSQPGSAFRRRCRGW